MLTGIAEYKATVPEFTKATSHSFPLPVLKDPDLIATYNKLSSLSKSLLFVSIGLDIADGIYAGIKYESFARGAYRTVTNLTTTGVAAGGSFVGAAVGTFVEPVGGTIVGGLLGGVVAGGVAGFGFSKLENYLFEEKKK
ncbi:hypothetical protein [Treponema sp.]|uniref:hypothetical protein n=1 Tax=Treponema sp. TaxID=166 RepID=UPI003890E5B4